MAPSLPSMWRLQRLHLRNMDLCGGSFIRGAQLALSARLPALRELLVEGGYEDDGAAHEALRLFTHITLLKLHQGDNENNPIILPSTCSAIATLTQLRTFMAPVCSVPDLSASLSALQCLEHLDVSIGNSHDIGDTFVVGGRSWILQLTRLTGLLVAGAATDAFASGAAAQLTGLRGLRIESCPPEEAEAKNLAAPTPAFAAALAELARLTALELQCISVSDAGAAAIARLPHLRRLDLTDCDFSDAGACAVAELAHGITSIAIRGRIGASGIAALGRLPWLADLTVRGHVTEECALALAACAQHLTSLSLASVGVRAISLAPETIAALKRLPCLSRLLLDHCEVQADAVVRAE